MQERNEGHDVEPRVDYTVVSTMLDEVVTPETTHRRDSRLQTRPPERTSSTMGRQVTIIPS